jgi:hypothetical protein
MAAMFFVILIDYDDKLRKNLSEEENSLQPQYCDV